MSSRVANRRIRLLLVLVGAVLVSVVVRAVWLQAIESTALDARADSQSQDTIITSPRRGTIFDRRGRELAIGELRTTVFANPRHIDDPAGVADVAAADLELDRDAVLAKLSDTSRGFVYLERKADPALATKLQERGIEGIGFEQEEQRIYPQRGVASEVVGFAGLDNEGLEGIEQHYDALLAGEPGSETVVRDPYGRTIDVLETSPVREGHDLYLTIDHRLQSYVERVLRQTRGRWRAKAATAIVLDPHSGAVLAMASEPGFEPAKLEEATSEELRNRAVTDSYEPGSTFKVVTVAAALEEGILEPESSFVLPFEIEVADRTIREVDYRETEKMTLSDIIAHSSNVGAITVALRLGQKRLASWIERFGFGQQTGIDFPGETPGIVIPREEWSGSTIGNLPIGQGLAATPIQMAAMYGTIANEGVWNQPHIVQRIDGGRKELERAEPRRVVSKGTARRLTRMLERVVTGGSGTRAHVAGYRVAGKTGTSAKVEPSGVYSTKRYVASFVGFAPSRDPKLVVLVAVDEPRGAIFGGAVAAPAFSAITSFALQHFEIPPNAQPGGSR